MTKTLSEMGDMDINGSVHRRRHENVVDVPSERTLLQCRKPVRILYIKMRFLSHFRYVWASTYSPQCHGLFVSTS